MTDIDSSATDQPGRQPFTLDAAFVARSFDLTTARVRALMARGLFRSMVEKGEAEDAGNWRLTLRCGNRVWRGVVGSDGAIRQQSMGLVSSKSRRCGDR
jgi:hypothetical protein